MQNGYSNYSVHRFPANNRENPSVEANNNNNEANTTENGNSGARTFTFRELAMATKNFRQECLLAEGGFGKVYKATLQNGEVISTTTFTYYLFCFQIESLIIRSKV